MNRTAAITAVLGLAVAGGVLYRVFNPPATLLKTVPADVLKKQPELEPAYRNYVKNGGEYIWGANDCSIFVSDYINQCGNPCPFRPTTKELIDPAFMAKVGFTSASGQIRPGDVIVFRYLNADRQWRGHTGVVVWYDGANWVMHNTERYQGMVVETLDRFWARADAATKGNPDLRKVFRRRDANL
ncbi:MAG: C40 family peptidase [Armatimonadetes bacterium]|nr:C40 family peptidase [Armatimonadota bacterium]MBX3109320.1 C40 family peptidase [Fimbriimonadaceae bacterium]